MERRDSIIKAACPLFAKEGFRGVTTKKLATEARISEALLYQHFPSKEAIYEEVLDMVSSFPDHLSEAISQRPASTKTLVSLLHLLCYSVIHSPFEAESKGLITRMMLQSLLDDGEFAASFIERNIQSRLPHISACIEKADQAGETIETNTPPETRFWLAHHALVCMKHISIPGNNIVDYKQTKDELLISSLEFILRGHQRHFNARKNGKFLAANIY